MHDKDFKHLFSRERWKIGMAKSNANFCGTMLGGSPLNCTRSQLIHNLVVFEAKHNSNVHTQ